MYFSILQRQISCHLKTSLVCLHHWTTLNQLFYSCHTTCDATRSADVVARLSGVATATTSVEMFIAGPIEKRQLSCHVICCSPGCTFSKKKTNIRHLRNYNYNNFWSMKIIVCFPGSHTLTKSFQRCSFFLVQLGITILIKYFFFLLHTK